MSALGYHQFNRDRDDVRSQLEQHLRSFPEGHKEPPARIAIDVPDTCSPDLWGAYNERTAPSRFVPVAAFIIGGIVAGSLLGALIMAAITAYNTAILGAL